MSFLDMIRPKDPFGVAAVRLMWRIRAVGYKPALEEQCETPFLETRDWADMIVALLADREPPPMDCEESTTYRCSKCRDTCFNMRVDQWGIAYAGHCVCHSSGVCVCPKPDSTSLTGRDTRPKPFVRAL